MKTTFWLWIPRIVIFFYIVFLFLFSFDTFSTDEPLIDQIGAFFIHSIPSWLLIAVLALTWKKPFLTGAILLILGVLTIPFFETYLHLSGFMVVTLPPILIGGAFIVYDKMIKDTE
jgi:hypothetical protein